MTDLKYHYQKTKKKPKKRYRLVILILFILAVIAGLIIYDIYKNRAKSVEGPTNTFNIGTSTSPTQDINEATFTMKLPGDWKELERKQSTQDNYVIWHSTQDKQSERTLTVYVDDIPLTKAVNLLVPLGTSGAKLKVGNISDNCVTFTKGGTFDAALAPKTRETLAKWQDINFICDLPRPYDTNIGTASADGVNIVNVTGASGKTHKYFFLYVDHNKQQNNQIFLDILRSFEAK